MSTQNTKKNKDPGLCTQIFTWIHKYTWLMESTISSVIIQPFRLIHEKIYVRIYIYKLFPKNNEKKVE